MDVELRDGELITSLEYKGLRLIQKRGGSEVSTDSVLLASYVRAKPGERLLDIGCGTGVIALLCGARTGAQTTGLELQPEIFDIAKRNAALNPEVSFEPTEGDLRTARIGSFDLAVCNPPFFAGGAVSPNSERAAARHELTCTIDEVADCAARNLKNGGSFYMIYPADGLAAAFAALRAAGLEPKRLLCVAARADKPAKRVLIQARKGGGEGLIIEPTLIMHDNDGEYTPRMKQMYHIEEDTDGQ